MWRRWPAIVLGVVLALLTLAVACGWYVSTQFERRTPLPTLADVRRVLPVQFPRRARLDGALQLDSLDRTVFVKLRMPAADLPAFLATGFQHTSRCRPTLQPGDGRALRWSSDEVGAAWWDPRKVHGQVAQLPLYYGGEAETTQSIDLLVITRGDRATVYLVAQYQ